MCAYLSGIPSWHNGNIFPGVSNMNNSEYYWQIDRYQATIQYNKVYNKQFCDALYICLPYVQVCNPFAAYVTI